MLGKLIAAAVTAGVAKKAWDRYHAPKAALPEDLTDYVGRAEAAEPAPKRKAAKKSTSRRKSEGPSE